MPNNIRNGNARATMAKDSAIPKMTINVPIPRNVKPPAKTPIKKASPVSVACAYLPTASTSSPKRDMSRFCNR